MSQTRIKIKKSKRKTGLVRRSAKYWMALGTMAAYSTVGGDALTKVYARQDRSAPAVQASGQTRSSDSSTLRYSPRDPGRRARGV